MLAGFDQTGALRSLTAPNIDYPQHIFKTRLGVRLRDRSRIEWIRGSVEWRHSQTYEGSGGIVHTESENAAGIQVIQRSQVRGLGLEMEVSTEPSVTAVIWEIQFQMGGRRSDNAIRFDPELGCLVAYHRNHALAIVARPAPTRFAGGSLRPGDHSTQWSKGPGFSYVGHVWGRLNTIKSFRDQAVRILLAYGTPDEAPKALRKLVSDQMPALSADAKPSPIGLDGHDELYERSLVVIDQLRDHSGALIAGPAIDPENRTSGGYAFCWPRDGAFIAHALDAAGRHSAARQFYEWALRVPRPHGIWAQRYYTDGTPAPTWAEHQLDETGTILWALDHHLRVETNSRLEARGLGTAVDAFQTIERLASVRGWPPPTQNLWEDHFGQHAYTLASLLAAAKAWEKRARDVSDVQAAALFGDAVAALKRALDDWPTRGDGVLARSIVPGKSRAAGRSDFTADISVLGLAVPFQILPATDEKLQATVASTISHLSNSHGRMLRYGGDRYRGGNPWPLANLWLAWYQVTSGQVEQARRTLNDVLRDRTPSGLLAEQVDGGTGAARWVVPLSWAHAWYIVVSHQLLQKDSATAPLA